MCCLVACYACECYYSKQAGRGNSCDDLVIAGETPYTKEAKLLNCSLSGISIMRELRELMSLGLGGEHGFVFTDCKRR